MIAVSDELVRRRSYEIWLRDGCPHGLAVRHWIEAKIELDADLCITRLPSPGFNYRMMVLPRPEISRPPHRQLSRRIGDRTVA